MENNSVKYEAPTAEVLSFENDYIFAALNAPEIEPDFANNSHFIIIPM